MTALCSGKICTIFPEKGALNFWKACTIALEYSHTFDRKKIDICEGCKRYEYCRNTRCKLINDIVEGNPYIPIAVHCQIENIIVEVDEYMDLINTN